MDIRSSGQIADTGARSTLLMPAVTNSPQLLRQAVTATPQQQHRQASPKLSHSSHTAPSSSSGGLRHSGGSVTAASMGQSNPMLHSPSLSEHQYDVPFSHLIKPLDPVDVSGYSELGM